MSILYSMIVKGASILLYKTKIWEESPFKFEGHTKGAWKCMQQEPYECPSSMPFALWMALFMPWYALCPLKYLCKNTLWKWRKWRKIKWKENVEEERRNPEPI